MTRPLPPDVFLRDVGCRLEEDVLARDVPEVGFPRLPSPVSCGPVFRSELDMALRYSAVMTSTPPI